jgi:hypothetical protein
MTTDETSKKYPFFKDFVRSHMPTVARKATVVRAYAKWAQLDDRAARVSLKYGTTPTLVVADFMCEADPSTGRSRISTGMTFSEKKIGIAQAVVARYEHCAVLALQKEKDKVARLGLWSAYLEATIMHELVHWGRMLKGVTAKRYAEEEKFSAAFEKEAYGRVAQTPDPLCFDIEIYTPSD